MDKVYASGPCQNETYFLVVHISSSLFCLRNVMTAKAYLLDAARSFTEIYEGQEFILFPKIPDKYSLSIKAKSISTELKHILKTSLDLELLDLSPLIYNINLYKDTKRSLMAE